MDKRRENLSHRLLERRESLFILSREPRCLSRERDAERLNPCRQSANA